MPDCPSLPRCPFFNDRMQSIPAMAILYKEKYCHGIYEQCARFLVSKALGRENVPSDLFPNQSDRVKSVIEKGKKP